MNKKSAAQRRQGLQKLRKADLANNEGSSGRYEGLLSELDAILISTVRCGSHGIIQWAVRGVRAIIAGSRCRPPMPTSGMFSDRRWQICARVRTYYIESGFRPCCP